MIRTRTGLGGLLLSAALILLAPACSGEPGPEPGAPPGEYARLLREGIDQIRRYRPELARATLDRCLAIRSEDPDLLFHLARLEQIEDGTKARDGEGPLQRLLRREPGSVRGHMLAAEISLEKGEREAARPHLAKVADAYGRLGTLEIGLRSLIEKEGLERAAELIAQYSGDGSPAGDVALAFDKLSHQGGYEPERAFEAFEAVLADQEDAAALRIVFARTLVTGQVRLAGRGRDDLPPLSSRLILDYAQSRLEEAFDLVNPRSRMAREALYWLAQVAYRMGDYDEATAQTDLLLTWHDNDEKEKSRLITLKGFARLRQERVEEAITLLRSALAITPGGSGQDLPIRWLLHLAGLKSVTGELPGAEPFSFREGIRLAAGATDMSFTDQAARLGVDKLDGLGPSAWGDYDKDGDFDLFVTGCDSYGALYRNDGDRFVDVSREAGLLHVQSGFSATFADYDNDGFPDIYVGRDGWNGPVPNSLYRNAGDGTFDEVTGAAGLGDTGSTFVHTWSDVDRDGDLDLFLANGITGAGDTNRLYLNNGDGTFTDDTERSGLREEPGTKTIGAAFGDYDGDAWPDLFVSGYFGPNRLYRNLGDGTFEEVAAEAGVDGLEHRSTGYVVFFADFDNDLRPDILRTSLAEWKVVLEDLSGVLATRPPRYRIPVLRHLSPKLYRNLGNGSFAEISDQAGLSVPMGIMGGNTGDLNNDGFLDLYFGTGDPEVDRLEPDRLFRGTPSGKFEDHTFASGLGNIGKGHGVTMVDLDGDGDLEIYAPEGGFVHGDPWANALYMNGQQTGNSWLQLDLVGVASNRDAVDARVIARAGGRAFMREVKNGEGFGSSNSPTVELGLGKAPSVDQLEIRWPSGKVQSFRRVAANQRLVVVEGKDPVPWPGDPIAGPSAQ